MNELGRDYFILVYTAAVGVLQVAAAYSRLDGLLFFRRRLLAGTFGLALIVGVLVWFFASGSRNVPDTAGGLDGTTQTWLFAAAAGAALVLTLVVSSILNKRLWGRDVVGKGLDALRDTTYARAVAEGVRTWRTTWQQWTQKLFSG